MCESESVLAMRHSFEQVPAEMMPFGICGSGTITPMRAAFETRQWNIEQHHRVTIADHSAFRPALASSLQSNQAKAAECEETLIRQWCRSLWTTGVNLGGVGGAFYMPRD